MNQEEIIAQSSTEEPCPEGAEEVTIQKPFKLSIACFFQGFNIAVASLALVSWLIFCTKKTTMSLAVNKLTGNVIIAAGLIFGVHYFVASFTQKKIKISSQIVKCIVFTFGLYFFYSNVEMWKGICGLFTILGLIVSSFMYHVYMHERFEVLLMGWIIAAGYEA